MAKAATKKARQKAKKTKNSDDAEKKAEQPQNSEPTEQENKKEQNAETKKANNNNNHRKNGFDRNRNRNKRKAEEESTHAKYERIKKGSLYLTDLQKLTVTELHEIAKKENIKIMRRASFPGISGAHL